MPWAGVPHRPRIVCQHPRRQEKTLYLREVLRMRMSALDALGETPESVPARDVEEFVESFTNIVQRRPLLFPIAG